MEMNTDNIQAFDPLASNVKSIAAPAMDVIVTDSQSSGEALIVVKQVKFIKDAIEERRKLLVGPLNAEVKTINEYAKSLMADLVKAEAHVKEQLVSHEKRLEQERLEALRTLEVERIEREKAAQIEKQKLEVESLFGVKSENEVNQKLDELELIHREDKELDKLAAENIAENKISGTRKVWSFQVEDESKIPRKYLMVDARLIREAIRDGIRKIDGVHIFEETKIAIRGGL